MTTKTQLRIIELLLSTETPLSIREISRRLSQSYPLVYNNIQELHRNKILLKQEVPPAQIITLNPLADLQVLIAAENLKKENFLCKHKWVKLFLTDFQTFSSTSYFSVIVFGSYAKGKEHKSSDLDLLLITPDNVFSTEVNSALARCYTKAKKHIVIVTEREFSEMLAKPLELNVGNEVIKNHIILYGAEQYYAQLKRARR